MLVKDQPILVGQVNQSDYLNLVQLAQAWTGNEDDASHAVSNWMRNRNTLDYLATWEKLYGAGDLFDEEVYMGYVADSTRNTFSMSPLKWVETTHSIGMEVKRGRGGGVYAHEDLALEFCSWLDPVFKLFVYKEFQRLKAEESQRLSLDWNLNRTLSKVNYQLHTDSIKDNIVSALPSALGPIDRRKKEVRIYSSEADMLNKVVFGLTAAEWRTQNPHAKAKENVRDYASSKQLLVLSNMENLNATLMDDGHLDQRMRFTYLAEKAARQFVSLSDSVSANRLSETLKLLQTGKGPEALGTGE